MSSKRNGQLNLAMATEAELQTLPGIGRVMARRIIASRQSERFKHISDLLRVRGFSQALYDQIAEQVFLAPEAGSIDPIMKAIAFGSKRKGKTGQSLQPIDFYGTPRRLTGVVPLVNTGDQSVRLAAFGLDKTELRAPNGAAMTEVPFRRWLQPGEQVSAPIALALDQRTPPGTYKAEFVLGDQRQPVIFHVAEVVKLRVAPERLVVDNRPGSRETKTIFVTNLGNVNIELGDIGVVGLEESNIICNTIREAVGQLKDPDLDTTVAAFVNTLNKSFQESRALIVRTRGKPIQVTPGETVSVELSMGLPQSLHSRRRYFGSMHLYHASIPILVQPTGSTGEVDMADEKSGGNHAT